MCIMQNAKNKVKEQKNDIDKFLGQGEHYNKTKMKEIVHHQKTNLRVVTSSLGDDSFVLGNKTTGISFSFAYVAPPQSAHIRYRI